jgi:hypothetical protein
MGLAALVCVSFATVGAGSAWGWRLQRAVNPAGSKQNVLKSVSCPSRRMCIAVGYSAKGALVERWDGERWSIQHAPASGEDARLEGVSCSSTSACVAVGSRSAGGLVEVWNGGSWSVERLGGPIAYLDAVSCWSRSRCMAVGGTDRAPPNALGVALLNGRHWSVHALSGPVDRVASLAGVSCSSRHDCTAVGALGSPFSSTLVVERWNGSRWSTQSAPNPAGSAESAGSSLNAVSCASPSSCTAVGNYDVGGPPPSSSIPALTLAESWNDVLWSVQPTVNPGGAHSYDGFEGVSCPARQMCIAVGSTRAGTLAEVWNGGRWSLERTPSRGGSASLDAVSCPSKIFCMAVGSYSPRGSPDTALTLAERGP